jgi:hypothetical protein
MFAHRPLAAMLAVFTLSLTSPATVSAGFLSVSGGGNVLNPAQTATGATKDFFDDTGANKLIHGWNEQQDVTLDRDIHVDIVHPGVFDHNNDLGYFRQHKIAKGTVVSSHLLYYDPMNVHRVENVVFVFDAPIVGIIVDSDRFFDAAHNFTDYFLETDFLGNPDSLYPTTHYNDRGLELNQFDEFTFSVSGNRLCLNWGASTPGDQIRVITAQSPGPGPTNVSTVPAPAGIILALAGGACLGVGRLIRRRSG